MLCSKRCHNKILKCKIDKETTNQSKKKHVPWATDGAKGTNDPINSLNVLVEIIGVVETYNKWRGGTKCNGMRSR